MVYVLYEFNDIIRTAIAYYYLTNTSIESFEIAKIFAIRIQNLLNRNKGISRR